MKDIEDKLAAFLMEYGILKNRDAEKMAHKIAGMVEKEREELSTELDKLRCAYGNVCDNAAITEKERDQLAAKFPDIGPDPLKLDGDDRKTRYSVEGSKAHLTKASCVQQTGVPDQTALVWRADLMKVCDDHTWRSVHLPALQEMTKQRDQLSAKCAEMRELVELMAPTFAEDPEDMTRINHALSSDCGKGWLSPERKERLRRKLICLKEVVCTEDSALVQEVLDEIQ